MLFATNYRVHFVAYTHGQHMADFSRTSRIDALHGNVSKMRERMSEDEASFNTRIEKHHSQKELLPGSSAQLQSDLHVFYLPDEKSGSSEDTNSQRSHAVSES